MRFTKELFGDPVANQHIAEVTGQHYHVRPYAWVSGDKSFSHVTGGIFLPSFGEPGYLLAVGVQHGNHNIVECLVELEDDDEYALINKVKSIQEEYGPGVIRNWWGDPADLMSLVNELSTEKNPVLIASPIDSDKPDHFQLCLSRLRVSLRANSKTLLINSCDILRNHIMTFVKDKSETAKKNPAITVAGGLIHTLSLTRPWERSLHVSTLIPTTLEEYATYEQEKAIEHLNAEVYGEY